MPALLSKKALLRVVMSVVMGIVMIAITTSNRLPLVVINISYAQDWADIDATLNDPGLGNITGNTFSGVDLNTGERFGQVTSSSRGSGWGPGGGGGGILSNRANLLSRLLQLLTLLVGSQSAVKNSTFRAQNNLYNSADRENKAAGQSSESFGDRGSFGSGTGGGSAPGTSTPGTGYSNPQRSDGHCSNGQCQADDAYRETDLNQDELTVRDDTSAAPFGVWNSIPAGRLDASESF